jgi:hypothetical protein
MKKIVFYILKVTEVRSRIRSWIRIRIHSQKYVRIWGSRPVPKCYGSGTLVFLLFLICFQSNKDFWTESLASSPSLALILKEIVFVFLPILHGMLRSHVLLLKHLS